MTLNAASPLADAAAARESLAVGGVRAGLLSLGLGPLVDADQGRELAQLQALQARQQFTARRLSMADQAPQTLLSLFK
jgi:flagellin-like hook-associated protein FlgL